MNDITFSPDGKYLLTASNDGSARRWDAVSGKKLHCYLGYTGTVNNVTFSPAGRYLLTGGADETMRLWDAQTGQELSRFTGDRQEVWSSRFR